MNENNLPRDEGSSSPNQIAQTIPISPYSNIQRSITEEDLQFPAVQRILLSEVDKLESRNLVLENQIGNCHNDYKLLNEKFHTVDKEKTVLDEKLKTNKAQEVLYSFCLTSGSIIIGLSKTVWDQGLGPIFLGLGFFLILGGLITKITKWK
ncbi:hypothetical protein [Chryseobacterium sp.]|uniref:hypothetical protein n=1 Tax=Chryseobacterium sp. TaxID=1871047 RepID=UPI000EBF670B|nr:hypothetical protein [Chryseobacterium sp.]HCA10031.1 hypothetical protein [Chryseobacterium sp.]